MVEETTSTLTKAELAAEVERLRAKLAAGESSEAKLPETGSRRLD